MATTEHFYTGNGSTTTYSFTFPYLKNADIKVSLDDVLKTETTHYTVSSTNIVFGSAPGSNVAIRIYRDTDVDTSKATFAAGSSIRAGDLNNNNTQLLYNAQEQKQLIRTAGIAAGQVISTTILADTIVNADVNSSAAIAGTKINPNFGSQAVSTTGTAATGALTVTGNIGLSGTIDGRDLVNDGNKLDTIENSATQDQTESEIRLLVQNATDSNVLTDALKSKLDGIENTATADQTNAEIKTAYEANSDTNAYTDAEKTKLSGVAAGAEVNVQSDWNASSGDAQILNKPTIGSAITVQEEGSSLSTAATTLNFVGSTVTASGTGGTKTITISGGGEVTVQDEGSSLSTAATTINFVGAGVTASGTGATKTITISGSGGGAVTTDFQYLELKAHNNASGAFSAGAADYELVTKDTNTVESPSEAAALLISIAGVIQQPNTGTSIGSNDGFCIDGSSIHFGANLTAHPDFIIYLQGAGVASIADNTVTGAKIALGSDAAGDVMYYNGTDYVRLAKGTNGHYLKQGTSNAPEWAAVDTTIADDSIAEVKLDISNTASDGQYLQYKDNTDKLTWSTVSTTPTTTRGDIIYRAASADARLAKGTAGQYLKIGANDPEWADVVGAVADGCIFENDQTISNNYTIASGKGAHSVGPITVNATVTVNGNWVVS